ncbi:protein CROWDED NUCLEI 4 isoform X2 [Amaranthus tricolor]|uniref:protein CROWDED NUCLEI 4 isoform X2 n=1 Tax=Amaranthus tricolor TaxID=29722 RepID=UPI00258B4E92|nr:protein CROWDED NUCLEI 4 isoform X2 [Amaranthus tricolor]
MASPRIPATPTTLRPINITPGSRILDVSSTPSTNGCTPFSDDGIWKRLRDAGFDEDSIRRRDKAALIAYIAKLEAEIYELQHNMGLLILERKDYASKYEESRLSVESIEVKHMRDQAALTSALAEARKREDNLKKALGVEKECVVNLEKALHEMRTECAEVKVTAECKISEAHTMIEAAQGKFIEAEAKLRSAESLRDEARRSKCAAERKLQEVEAREDDLRRRMASFKSDCDAKEKEIMLERQSLIERQKVLSEAQNKVLDGQALLNQREADFLIKSQTLRRNEKELEDQKVNLTSEWKILKEQKSNLELNAVSLSEREKAVFEKEILLNKREKDLLVSQEKIASKEHSEVQKYIAEQENALRHRKEEFEAELMVKQKLVEEDIESKKRTWELSELDLKQREDHILEKEQDLEVQARVIADKGKVLAENLKAVKEKESLLHKSENEVEQMKSTLQKEREEIDKVKIDLEKSLLCFEEEKKQIAEAKKRLELMTSESNELLILETKLKEEIDTIRAQKLHLEAEAEKLKVEQAKFETEWEVIDEKREELRREEERIAGERLAISKFLKDERDSLNLEKEALREQYKHDLESLALDREAFRSECQHEHSEWFSKFQQERADFLLEIECRKRELEDCINKRRDDIESYSKEKEKSFEEEKKRELQYISSLKEGLMKEQEHVAIALKKLEAEKLEIKSDREERDKAWAELQNLIEELQMQRFKLKEQRELLHADREKINCQIEQLKRLEDVKIDSDKIIVPLTKQMCAETTPEVCVHIPSLEPTQKVTVVEDRQDTGSDSPSSSVSWLKKCASLLFKPLPESVSLKRLEPSLQPGGEGQLELSENECLSLDGVIGSELEIFNKQHAGTAVEEPKVIHEVPSVDEDFIDLEATMDVRTSSATPSEFSAGHKRRVDQSSGSETADALRNDEKVKRRKLQKVTDASDGFQNVTPHCVELKQASDVDDQYLISVSTQSVEQSEFGKSEEETFRCVIQKQTFIEEVLIVEDVGDEKRIDEEEGASKLKEPQDEDISSAKLEKPEIIQERVMTRSKSKQAS